ncbi:helix-turn-helix domain-containing protein [Flavobacterium sp. TR2]|uniref:helix-turn-helix domain-containing protein n=1 Tax=Flavobacterium sp. TR2 TaxID=2977321 RepID=UPI0021B14121|nr:helix-turn-helix domain-containing protein [Flavobacterium sp. TR2]UWY27013.1 helix-turn-helix domain-containing protein [Flavobacterium sp. TR2]
MKNSKTLDGVSLDAVNKAVILKKLFLQAGFSLDQLSLETGIHRNALSYLINSQAGYNFNDYINLMRIRYFKEKVLTSEWNGFTVKMMTEASGFTCRTTSYRSFKRHLGLGPEEYLKTIRTE